MARPLPLPKKPPARGQVHAHIEIRTADGSKVEMAGTFESDKLFKALMAVHAAAVKSAA